MGFFDSLKSIFAPGGSPKRGDNGYWIYVRCHRCGDGIKTRLDLQHSLNPDDQGGYLVRKTLVGNQLCFERVEVTLRFDANHRLVDQEASGGDIITAEEFEALSAHI